MTLAFGMLFFRRGF